MKVRCDRNEIAECVGDVLGIIPATQVQTTKPILRDFHLKTEEGHLIVEATDLDMAARIRSDRVEVLEAGELALPAVRFSSLVREIPEKSVFIESLSQGGGAMVRAGGYEFKLLGDDPAEFPEVPVFRSEKAFAVNRERFLETLRRVAVASSRDTARFQLTGVNFEVSGETMVLTATDGKRLTNDTIRVENPLGVEASAIVPNRTVDVLLKVLAQGEATFQMAMDDPDVQVSFGRGELTAKVIQGTFPDYRTALPKDVRRRVTVKKADLVAATRTASLMTDRETSTVRFVFEADKVSLQTQASDIGESRIEVPITLEGESVEVRFNPAYFLDALRCVSDEEVRLEFSEAEKPAVVRGGLHYRHLVMPLVTRE